ncbi:MAG: hypothetical protein Q8M29_06440 [Bacteroidota bacterium]|nr:hypothetical protein [Bacteroidota bacterium]
MNKEESIAELAVYQQYELKQLKLKDSEDEYETIDQVFIGPQNSSTFREFYKMFVKGKRSHSVINAFFGSNMTIYFQVGSDDKSDGTCIALDLFLQTYEI